LAKSRCILALELRVQPAVVQDHETETVRLEGGTLAGPAIGIRPRRIVQPIAAVGKVAAQRRQEVVPGIVVLVEADVVGPLCPKDGRAAQDGRAEPQQGKARSYSAPPELGGADADGVLAS
jgi:hypothetical protein